MLRATVAQAPMRPVCPRLVSLCCTARVIEPAADVIGSGGDRPQRQAPRWLAGLVGVAVVAGAVWALRPAGGERPTPELTPTSTATPLTLPSPPAAYLVVASAGITAHLAENMLRLSFDLMNVGATDVSVIEMSGSVPGLTLRSSGGAAIPSGLPPVSQPFVADLQPFPIGVSARGGTAPINLFFEISSCADLTTERSQSIQIVAEVAGERVVTAVDLGTTADPWQVRATLNLCG